MYCIYYLFNYNKLIIIIKNIKKKVVVALSAVVEYERGWKMLSAVNEGANNKEGYCKGMKGNQ